MAEKPLERIVLHCEGCKGETTYKLTETRPVSFSIYKTSRDAIHLEKPFCKYSCEICKTIYTFLEKRSYDKQREREEERRRNR